MGVKKDAKNNWQIVLLKKAEKNFANIDQKYEARILTALLSLRENPLIGKKLLGSLEGYFSLRVWPYRIIYFLNGDKKEVVIVKISHRQASYS
jgi:mRNA interferase RelE/StbE